MRVLSTAVVLAGVAVLVGCGDASSPQTDNQAASSPPPAATSVATPSPSSIPLVPSDLVNERLDVAETELNEKGVGYNEVGGGSLGIVVKSNWIVCQTRPAVGQPITGKVDLIVQHYSCTNP